MNPALVAAAFGDGSDADASLDGGGVREALALLAEGSQQPRREDRARPRQSAEEAVVGQLLAQPGDRAVEALNGSRDGSELGKRDPPR
jgi:hypothetical protein